MATLGDRPSVMSATGNVRVSTLPVTSRLRFTEFFAATPVKPPADAMASTMVMFGKYGTGPGRVTWPSTETLRLFHSLTITVTCGFSR